MENNTQVSIIIPTYNSALYIADAIYSALNQTYNHTEIIVVDNNSTDNTEQIVKDIQKNYADKILYLKEPQPGANYARNTGLMHAQGKFIQFLDADDMLLPDKIEKQLAEFLKDGNIDVVYSDYEKYDNTFDKLLKTITLNIPHNILEKCIKHVIAIQNPLYKKKCLIAGGMFDVELSSAQDWDINLRLILLGNKFTYLQGVYSKIREVSHSVSSDWVKVSFNQCKVLYKYKELIKSSVYYNTSVHNAIQLIHYNTMLYTCNPRHFKQTYIYYSYWHINYSFIHNPLKKMIARCFGLKFLLQINKIFKSR